MQNWKRNLVLIWLGQFLTMLGMSAIVPFLPLFIKELGVTNTEVVANWSGWIFGAPFIVSFFLTPVWGTIGDRFGRKIVAGRAILGLGVAQLLIGFAPSIEFLLLGRLFQGALSGFTPDAMALVVSTSPKEKTGYSLGLLQTAQAAGTVIGPFVGGFLADMFGNRNVFFMVSALLLINGILFLIFVTERKEKITKQYNIFQNARFVFNNRILLGTSILVSLTAFGFAFIRPIFVLYLERFDIAKSFFATTAGALYGIAGIFTALFSAWWGKRSEKTGVRQNLIFASGIVSSMYFVHLFLTNHYQLIPVRALLGFGYAGMLPLLFTIISNNTPSHRKSGIMSIGSSFQILGNVTGLILSGVVASGFGLLQPFAISGSVFLLIITLLLFAGKDKHYTK